MNKKAMVREIIQPVMEEKGFELIDDKKGSWIWFKEVYGVDEKVYVTDLDGMLSLELGIARNNVLSTQGSKLLNTLESPRTNVAEWHYRLSEDKESRYRNILLDFRDILEKNCDIEIEKNAQELKKIIEDSTRRFTLFCDKYVELEKYYADLFHVAEKPISLVIEEILGKVIEFHGKPLKEVEHKLVGYAVLIESLLMQLDGVKKKINMEYQSSILVNRKNYSVNILNDIFYSWKSLDYMPIFKYSIDSFIQSI